MSDITRVPFDPQLVEGFQKFKDEYEYELLTAETILSYRERFLGSDDAIEGMVRDLPVTVEDRLVPGPEGAPEVLVTIVRPEGGVRTPAGIYGIHGGGMVLGTRAGAMDLILPYVVAHGCIGVTVEYRLAPEHPHPAPVEDCYAGLKWMAEHADELGIDPERILVTGASAGGGLSAGTALLARDRGFPKLAGQGLICPMIDDRNATLSSRQHQDVGVWPGSFNETGWDALVGAENRGTDRVSPYAAPTRMQDLSGLAPAFIEVGAAEVFRDESVDYATRIWATGGQAELHVWAGGFHGFDMYAPESELARAALDSRDSWLRRVFAAAPQRRLPAPTR